MKLLPVTAVVLSVLVFSCRPVEGQARGLDRILVRLEASAQDYPSVKACVDECKKPIDSGSKKLSQQLPCLGTCRNILMDLQLNKYRG